MRYPGVPANAPCYFGVPAYLLRRLCASFLHWALTLNLRQRFHHKLRLYQVAGAIAESYRLAKQEAKGERNKVQGRRGQC